MGAFRFAGTAGGRRGVGRRTNPRREPIELQRRDGAYLRVRRDRRQPHQAIDEHAFFSAAHGGLICARRRLIERRLDQAVDDLAEPRQRLIDGELRLHASGAIRLEDEPDRDVGGDGRGVDGIKSFAGRARKQLTVYPVAWRPRRQQVQNTLRNRQLRRLERGAQRVDRPPLHFAAYPFHRRPGVAAHCIDEVLSADGRRGALDGVAVIHVNRHQRLFDHHRRHAGADGVGADAVQRGTAHFHQPRQLVGLIGTVGPLVGLWMDVDVLVREVAVIGGPGVGEDLVERGSVVAAVRELAIAPVDSDFVPVADVLVIRARQIDCAVVFELGKRDGVVHDRDPPFGAVVVVVAETERVPDFVCRQLANALERRLVEHSRALVAVDVGRQQAFENHVVLAIAQ